MIRKATLFAAAGLAVTSILTASPAEAAYRVIRWNGTGVCQIWNYALPTRPFPLNYRVMSRGMPTFKSALRAKHRNWRRWRCHF
jgi:hypothetical protein